MKEKEKNWEMPIHNKCGLPVELCKCEDAEVVWDEKLGKYVDVLNNY